MIGGKLARARKLWRNVLKEHAGFVSLPEAFMMDVGTFIDATVSGMVRVPSVGDSSHLELKQRSDGSRRSTGRSRSKSEAC